VAVARRGGALQIIDPATSRTVWNRIDERVEADDMFVALQETNGYLFWCTNAGCFGFAQLALDIENNPSANLVRLDGSSDLVWELVHRSFLKLLLIIHRENMAPYREPDVILALSGFLR